MNAATVTRLHPKAPAVLLVVEDDVVARVTLADELRTCGYKVLEASTADDAMTILTSVPVHLVFADVMLPGGRDGLEVARAARALQPPPHILLTSGHLGAADLRDAQDLGVFVPKPYSPSRVLALIRQALDPTWGS